MKKIIALVAIIMLFVPLTLSYGESIYIVQPNLKEVKYKSIVAPETVIPKPSCPSGWIPSIFVTPAVIAAYSADTGWNLNVISVFKVWAVDNGNNTWTAKAQVKDNKGNIFSASTNHIKLLVETMCCPSNENCQ